LAHFVQTAGNGLFLVLDLLEFVHLLPHLLHGFILVHSQRIDPARRSLRHEVVATQEGPQRLHEGEGARLAANLIGARWLCFPEI
jgi:hypothetical protein